MTWSISYIPSGKEPETKPGGGWTNLLRIAFKQTNQICSCQVAPSAAASPPCGRRRCGALFKILPGQNNNSHLALCFFFFAPHFMGKCRSGLKEMLLYEASALISLAAARPFTATSCIFSFSSSTASKDSLQPPPLHFLVSLQLKERSFGYGDNRELITIWKCRRSDANTWDEKSSWSSFSARLNCCCFFVQKSSGYHEFLQFSEEGSFTTLCVSDYRLHVCEGSQSL